MRARSWFHAIWGLLALLLAACSGSATPQLIGSYPRGAVATYVPPPNWALVVSDAYLALRVADVARAAEQAEALAYEYGGYVSEATSWYQDDRLHVTLTLAVPAATYDRLYDAVVRLGTVENERVRSAVIADSDGNPWNTHSSITLYLAPAVRALRLPALPSFGWNPVNTFRAAFGVFAGIATFVIDLLIWLTVVFGPFVLLGLGLRALVRRWRPRP